jgi:hypothetical protein
MTMPGNQAMDKTPRRAALAPLPVLVIAGRLDSLGTPLEMAWYLSKTRLMASTLEATRSAPRTALSVR